MNLKTQKLLCLAALLMLLPTMTIAQTDVVRRKPTTSGTTAKPHTTTPAKKQNPKKKQQTQQRTTTTPTSPSSTTKHSRTTKSSSSGPSLQNITITVNGVSFTMIAVQGGTFSMGATAEQGSDTLDSEKPIHQVTLSDYYIGQTEVTQALWQAVMGANPSFFRGSNLPVEQVSWDDCQTFISRLNKLTGKHFRLPTEAEWEFAARGGNKSQGYKYAGSNSLIDVAWYWKNSGDSLISGDWNWNRIKGNHCQTHIVGRRRSNELDLYDMTGNVWEWCQDYYDKDYYRKSKSYNPCNNTLASSHVLRGGGWCCDVVECKVSFRDRSGSECVYDFLGLRLAL